MASTTFNWIFPCVLGDIRWDHMCSSAAAAACKTHALLPLAAALEPLSNSLPYTRLALSDPRGWAFFLALHRRKIVEKMFVFRTFPRLPPPVLCESVFHDSAAATSNQPARLFGKMDSWNATLVIFSSTLICTFYCCIDTNRIPA